MAATKTTEAQVVLTLSDRLTAGLNRIQARLAGLSAGLGMERLTRHARDLGSRISALGPALAASTQRFGLLSAAIGLGGGGAIAATWGLTNRIAESAKEIENLSRLSGISAQAFQRLSFGADTVGISGEKLADIWKDVQDKVGDFVQTGGGGMVDFFENIAPKVGVTADDFARLSGPDALQLYVSSLEKANLSQSEMTFFMEAIASDSALLLPLLQNSGKRWAELGDEAERTGNIMSDAAIAMGADFGENVKSLQARLSGLANLIGVSLLPVMNEVVTGITDWWDANQDLVKSTVTEWVANFAQVLRDLMDPASELSGSIDGLVGAVMSFGEAISPVVDLIGGPGNAALAGLAFWIGQPLIGPMAGLTAAVIKLGAAFMMTLVGWIIGGLVLIGAAVYVLIQKWDEFIAYWQGTWDRIVSGFEQGFVLGVLNLLNEFNPVVHIARGIDAVFEYFTGISLLEVGEALTRGFFDGVESAWAAVVAWGAGIAESIISWFTVDLYGVGVAIVQSLIDGLNAAWANVTGFFNTKIAELTAGLPDWVKGPLGIEVTPRVLNADELDAAARSAADAAAGRVDGGGFLGMGQSETYERDRKAAYDSAYESELARLKAQNDALTYGIAPGDLPVPNIPVENIVSTSAPNVTVTPAPTINVSPAPAPSVPAAIPEVATQTVQAGTVEAAEIIIPDPIVANQPQTVTANQSVAITVNVTGMTQAEGQALVRRALQQASNDHAAAVTSALND